MEMLAALGGVVLTVVGGFVGAEIQARREHARWLREQRYGAFLAAISMLRRAAQLMHWVQSEASKGPDGDLERLQASSKAAAELVDRWPELSAGLALLGPETVDNALAAAASAIGGSDPCAVQAAEQELIGIMRKRLRVPR